MAKDLHTVVIVKNTAIKNDNGLTHHSRTKESFKNISNIGLFIQQIDEPFLKKGFSPYPGQTTFYYYLK